MPISIKKGNVGNIPIGGVIPIMGAFQSTQNSGTFTSAFIPLSGVITNDGFQRCDGSLINNTNSIFHNKYTPDITDSRFIQGSTSAGTLGGNSSNEITISQTNLPTHSHDISHTHTGSTQSQSTSTTSNAGSHNHSLRMYVFTPGFSSNAIPGPRSGVDIADYVQDTYWMGNNGDHNHSYSHTHTTSSSTQSTTLSSNGSGTFNSTAIDIRPKYITAVYLMRVL